MHDENAGQYSITTTKLKLPPLMPAGQLPPLPAPPSPSVVPTYLCRHCHRHRHRRIAVAIAVIIVVAVIIAIAASHASVSSPWLVTVGPRCITARWADIFTTATGAHHLQCEDLYLVPPKKVEEIDFLIKRAWGSPVQEGDCTDYHELLPYPFF